MLRAIIADGEPVGLRGLREVLAEAFEYTTIDESDSGRETIQRVAKNEYDLAIVGIPLPDIDGLDVVRELKKQRPRMPVLVMGADPDERAAMRVIRAGGQGYVSKRSTTDEIVSAVRKIMAGRRYVNPTLVETMVYDFEAGDDRPPHERLSMREFEVVGMIAQGKSIKQITEELRVSTNTVRTYCARIMKKMKMRTTGELIRYAIKHIPAAEPKQRPGTGHANRQGSGAHDGRARDRRTNDGLMEDQG